MDVQAARHIALALPEVTEAPHFDFNSFRVRGKIFVTVPPDQEHIHIFVDEQDRMLALAMYPAWVEPLHWGKKVAGLRIRLAYAESSAVHHLVRAAWRNKAPKRLVAASELSGPVA